jgi:DNA invertase Pin-like site-specific DNA recombinase
MAIINYIRVSTVSQNTVRQLVNVPSDRVFIDKCSGKNTNRPEFQQMLDFVREGDVINCHELSRLARNTKDLLNIVQALNEKGITINFIKEKLSFTGDNDPFQTLMLTMLGAVAQLERDISLERQREGIAIAKAAGKYKGRPSAFSEAEFSNIKAEFTNTKNKAALARKYNISRSYLYKIVA